jgi:predicted ATPase
MSDLLRLERIQIENYKSIEKCDVILQPITYLIGTNGSGKSNFLDAICFLRDCFSYNLTYAIKIRRGTQNFFYKDQSQKEIIDLKIFFSKSENRGNKSCYKLNITNKGNDLLISDSVGYEKDNLISNTIQENITSQDSSLLSLFKGHMDNEYKLIEQAGFYNFSPEIIRIPQEPSDNNFLENNGSNLCSILKRISEEKPEIKNRIEQYLTVVVPELVRVEVGESDGYEFLRFFDNNGRQFNARSMSDGTLRALGILTALLQDSPLVGIEEPETALHPAAAGVLHDAIREASLKKPVIVTSHSPDLLDDPNLDPDSILVTTMENGSTRIAPLGNASREAIKTHLYTAGELLRMNQLTPEPVA